MTYCIGMLVEDGLAMIADTRTNAGVDNISCYRKLHLTQIEGERIIALATAGSLSVTQTALSLVREGLKMPDGEEPETLETVPSLFRAAQLVGYALNKVRQDMDTANETDKIQTSASVLVGGQVGDGEIALFLVYSEGNFIQCQPDTPYLQIGEFKYGKPILDRALHRDTSLPEAVKLGLISFDSTIRSNISVGLPLDLVVIPDKALKGETRRIEADDDYFRDIGSRWSQALAEAHHNMPTPPWLAD